MGTYTFKENNDGLEGDRVVKNRYHLYIIQQFKYIIHK